MSMIDAYYGDYGMAEASARKRRSATSIANQQAAFLGQQRGTRNIADLTRKLTEGFRPKMASYGQRGFCLLYTSPSPRDRTRSRMPSSA